MSRCFEFLVTRFAAVSTDEGRSKTRLSIHSKSVHLKSPLRTLARNMHAGMSQPDKPNCPTRQPAVWKDSLKINYLTNCQQSTAALVMHQCTACQQPNCALRELNIAALDVVSFKSMTASMSATASSGSAFSACYFSSVESSSERLTTVPARAFATVATTKDNVEDG